MQALNAEYGVHSQDQQIVALDAFFGHHRGSLSISDYLTMWRLTYEEAQDQSGLQINNVGKTYLLLKKSGFTEKQKHEFRLQVQGDMSRFEELTAVINRFARSDEGGAGTSIPSMAKQYYGDEDDPYDGSWYDDDYDGSYDT